MGSPYPWHYTLCWPYYFLRPSLKRHSELEPRPLSCRFVMVRDEATIRLMFFGDMMPVRGGRIPRIDPAIRDLLADADLVIGNCEAPITHSTRARGPIFQIAIDFVQAFLTELGISPERCVLSVANNHMGDQGEDGLNITLEHLMSIGITPLGHRKSNQPPVEKIIRNRLRLGIVSWTHWLNRNVFRATLGIWRANEIQRQPWQAIKAAEELDCLVGIPHWDYEFQHFPRAETRMFAQRLMAQGFDLLVGHHPHVVQPIEWLDRRVCLYSLGNFNGYPGLPYVRWPVRLGFIFEVRLIASGQRCGNIAGYTIHPFVIEVKGGNVWLIALKRTARDIREKIAVRLRILFRVSDEVLYSGY